MEDHYNPQTEHSNKVKELNSNQFTASQMEETLPFMRRASGFSNDSDQDLGIDEQDDALTSAMLEQGEDEISPPTLLELDDNQPLLLENQQRVSASKSLKFDPKLERQSKPTNKQVSRMKNELQKIGNELKIKDTILTMTEKRNSRLKKKIESKAKKIETLKHMTKKEEYDKDLFIEIVQKKLEKYKSKNKELKTQNQVLKLDLSKHKMVQEELFKFEVYRNHIESTNNTDNTKQSLIEIKDNSKVSEYSPAEARVNKQSQVNTGSDTQSRENNNLLPEKFMSSMEDMVTSQELDLKLNGFKNLFLDLKSEIQSCFQSFQLKIGTLEKSVGNLNTQNKIVGDMVNLMKSQQKPSLGERPTQSMFSQTTEEGDLGKRALSSVSSESSLDDSCLQNILQKKENELMRNPTKKLKVQNSAILKAMQASEQDSLSASYSEQQKQAITIIENYGNHSADNNSSSDTTSKSGLSINKREIHQPPMNKISKSPLKIGIIRSVKSSSTEEESSESDMQPEYQPKKLMYTFKMTPKENHFQEPLKLNKIILFFSNFDADNFQISDYLQIFQIFIQLTSNWMTYSSNSTSKVVILNLEESQEFLLGAKNAQKNIEKEVKIFDLISTKNGVRDIDSNSYSTLFVIQNLLTIIYLSNESHFSTSQKEEVLKIKDVKCPDSYLAFAYKRMLNFIEFKRDKMTTPSKRGGESLFVEPQPLPEKNYSLLKIVINNLMGSLERQSIPFNTEELISTKSLSTKVSIQDLKVSSIYAFTKTATARKTIMTSKDYSEVLNAFRVLYCFRVMDKFKGVIFRANLGFFSNTKHNNSFEQVFIPYCLKFLELDQ